MVIEYAFRVKGRTVYSIVTRWIRRLRFNWFQSTEITKAGQLYTGIHSLSAEITLIIKYVTIVLFGKWNTASFQVPPGLKAFSGQALRSTEKSQWFSCYHTAMRCDDDNDDSISLEVASQQWCIWWWCLSLAAIEIEANKSIVDEERFILEPFISCSLLTTDYHYIV